ncbi:histone-lysine N-methyltransferase ATX2-like [Olea europaea subsp. europaea]|uniref:Histone-lysine N-methyltransferase ATX2-like n=1 Tax=Olea europaea subsp. europaea TaxID=158383 RepID=A0A8S0V3V3_OLEEU|nr:histone-lysine N-methyltransferase ATX2-like [Olea europaea subsp. europaea]
MVSQIIDRDNPKNPLPMRPPMTRFYSRRRKRIEESDIVEKSVGDEGLMKEKKRRRMGSTELTKLGIDCNALSNLNHQLRLQILDNGFGKFSKNRNCCSKVNYSDSIRKRRNSDYFENELKNSGALTKKWVRLSFEGADPNKFIGLQCKVYWPLEGEWYSGRVVDYIPETGRHHVKYEDEDEENVILAKERIKFYLSLEEMQNIKLKCCDKSLEADRIDVNEMVALAANLDECHDLEPGDIIWAKLTGHAMWPAIILDESLKVEHKGLNRISVEKSVVVQFFGTHDFARVPRKQVLSFLKGLLSSCHLKCKKQNFVRGLEEAKMYLSEQKLPKRMRQLRNGVEADNSDHEMGEDEGGAESAAEDLMGNGEIRRKLEDLKSCPFGVGDLQVISLGKIVKGSDNFQKEKLIWPEGYTAVRKFPSITDPSVCSLYKMEVMRDVDLRSQPLFRVTSDKGEEFKGSTPSACWNKIYKRIRKMRTRSLEAEVVSGQRLESGSDMFGFTHPEVSKMIQELSNSRLSLKSYQLASRMYKDLPVGYRPVHVEWKDLDKCNVCHMDEEYDDNLFLQCDKCRMMVHARCYGELQPVGGVLWLCNLCRPGAPEFSPPCCLCPVIGGAMKPTTDGRWAHLACAIWIPETCLTDVKKMEPIDGLSRINKDRWKLTCSICGISYGACIQCSNSTCRVAYHPLCARAAGFCVEPDDEDALSLIPFDDDVEDQCIQLLSFCRRHTPASSVRLSADECIGKKGFEHADCSPPSNPSGCARTEPYSYFKKIGRKETEVCAAASKRLYVENKPYLVGGCTPHMLTANEISSCALAGSKYSVDLQKLKCSQFNPPRNFHSMAEKYEYMGETFKKRLAFGKSGIHGFGVFAKQPHRAGDMVIEYTGEIIRPPVADRRERLIYNSLVGAGTYMFRIDDKRVIDATRAGSIAHLINHSCEPNCYSRVISINSDEHIVIFAKRDIKQWEELTYDYRFFSMEEKLACYCGFPRCRGVIGEGNEKGN